MNGFRHFRKRKPSQVSPFRLQLATNGPRRLQSSLAYQAEEGCSDSVQVDYFFFIPKQLAINAVTYPKNLFYRHMDSVVRRRAPQVPLNQPQLLYNTLTTISKMKDVDRQLVETKLLACAFHRFTQSTVKKLSGIEPELKQTHCGTFSEVVDCFLRMFDNWIQRIAAGEQGGDLEGLAALREYCNLVAEKEAYQLLQTPFAQQLSNRNCLLLLVKRLHDDRVNHGYQSVADVEGVNEYFIYRFKGLRRFAEEPLNLSNITNIVGELRQQLIYGFAAGLAMTFATGIAFYTQQKYGNFSEPFFVALVVSYIFKDRIKELTRSYANTGLMRRFGDYRTKLLRGGKGIDVGSVKQSASFIAKEKCDGEILAAAKRSRNGDMADYGLEHDILNYSRTIKVNERFFYARNILDLPRQWLDINIFNLEQFLHNIVPSADNIWSMGKTLPVRIKSQRVHHVIVVVRMKNDEASSVRSWCVVLGRKGIKRVVEREKEQPMDVLWQRHSDSVNYESLLQKQIKLLAEDDDERTLEDRLQPEVYSTESK
ncbi:hypothetical protein EDC56_1480 [Sinobacterium caligoides]|uniref:Uncharacterized protein n=1 Tax=Sinobacterium caligoides TaxID=933926 RepID=A0A3N2DML7_9GAMM|nr:hypothetical protein [Sinobacterium caligoides]ROS01056.1 hypothetical protein EDC56_1480 [Sinobacterium caligoides]